MNRLIQMGLPLAALAAAFWPASPAAVERFYASRAYVSVQSALTSGSNRIPFAALDVLIVTACLSWVVLAVRDLARAPARWRGGARIIGRTIAWSAALYLAFLAVWGLNYRRLRLAEKLPFEPAAVTADSARAAGARSVERLNTLYDRGHADGWPPADRVDPARRHRERRRRELRRLARLPARAGGRSVQRVDVSLRRADARRERTRPHGDGRGARCWTARGSARGPRPLRARRQPARRLGGVAGLRLVLESEPRGGRNGQLRRGRTPCAGRAAGRWSARSALAKKGYGPFSRKRSTAPFPDSVSGERRRRARRGVARITRVVDLLEEQPGGRRGQACRRRRRVRQKRRDRCRLEAPAPDLDEHADHPAHHLPQEVRPLDDHEHEIGLVHDLQPVDQHEGRRRRLVGIVAGASGREGLEIAHAGERARRLAHARGVDRLLHPPDEGFGKRGPPPRNLIEVPARDR